MNLVRTATKYAPASIDEVVFNNKDTEYFLKGMTTGKYSCENLILYGSNGTGKSTIANLMATAITGGSGLLINDSIDKFLARKDLTNFLNNTVLLYGDHKHKRCVVVFHELDKYTKSLYQLWNVMDEHKDSLSVIITTNDLMKIENAVQSRCDRYKFTQITPLEFATRAQKILQHEGVEMSLDEVDKYLEEHTTHNRDVRDYLRVLDKIIAMKNDGIFKTENDNI
jgi:replication-associated recombination protein RarA